MGRSKSEKERCRIAKEERAYWHAKAREEENDLRIEFMVKWAESFGEQWVTTAQLAPLAKEAGVREFSAPWSLVSLARRVLGRLVKDGDAERKCRGNAHVYRICV